MADSEVVFRFVADTSELDGALVGVQQQLGTLSEEAGGAAGALDGLTHATEEMGSTSLTTRRGMSGLSSALRLVSPEAAAAATAFSGLSRAARSGSLSLTGMRAAAASLLPTLGPILLAVGALSVVQNQLQEDLDAATAAMERQAATATRASRVHSDLTGSIADVSKRYAVFAGATTRAQQDADQLNQTIEDQTKAQIELNNQAIKDSAIREEANRQLRERADLAISLNNEMAAQELAEQKAADAAARSAAAQREAAAATRARVAAERDAAAAQAEQLATYSAGVERLETEFTSLQSRLLVVTEDLAVSAVDIGEAFDAAVAQIERDSEATIDGVLNISSAIEMSSSAISRRMEEDGKAAANTLFRVSQAAAVAQIAINTAVGISKSIADLGPVAGAIAAVGVGAIGAAQTAVVLSQSPPVEHIGTGMLGSSDPLAPDEILTRRTRSERTLTGAGVEALGGEAAVAVANSGQVPSSSSGSVVVVPWKHLDRQQARAAKADTRFSRAIQGAIDLGQAQRGW